MSAEKYITSINKLNGKNFKTWKAQIESILQDDGIIDALTELIEDETKPENKEARLIYDTNDKRVKKILLLSMDDKCLSQVIACKKSWQIWEKLTQLHEQRGDECRMSMQQEFYDMRMNRNESVTDYISRVESLYNHLIEIEVNIPDSVLVDKIVCGLPKQYFNFISIWQNVPADKRTIGYLTQRLMAEERLIEKFSKSENTLALTGEGTSKKGWTKKGYGLKKTWNKPSGKDKCHNCQQTGHWKRDCPLLKDGEEEEAVAVNTESFNVSTNEKWIVDSGATQHMTFDCTNFSSYKKLEEPKIVKLGNHEKIEGIGVGSIQAVNHEGKPVTLKNVLHVPELRRKLFSIVATTNTGNTWSGTQEKVFIKSPGGLVILVAEKEGSLFFLKMTEQGNEANYTQQEVTKLWHARYGHVNQDSLLKMARLKNVLGLEAIKDNHYKGKACDEVFCDACVKGKQTRASYGTSSRIKATKVGEIVHTDICGPVSTKTIGGCSYFTLFKDEFSGYRFIYRVAQKTCP